MSTHTPSDDVHAWPRAFQQDLDPAFLWLGRPHREVFEALGGAVMRGRPLLLLTGEAGTGKTMLAAAVAARLAEIGVVVGRVTYPSRDREDFWSAMLGAFGLPAGVGNPDAAVAHVARYVAGAARTSTRLLLVVDEAQALARDVLGEVLRAGDIAGNEEAGHPLSILLVGEAALDVTLAEPAQAGLAQRIALRRRLPALQDDEVAAYVRHRLRCVGAPPDVFTPDALAAIATLSRGLPRLVNTVCARAVAAGGVVDASVVERCARELTWLCDDRTRPAAPNAASPGSVMRGRRWRRRGAAAAALAGAGALALAAAGTGHRVTASWPADPGRPAASVSVGPEPARVLPVAGRLPPAPALSDGPKPGPPTLDGPAEPLPSPAGTREPAGARTTPPPAQAAPAPGAGRDGAGRPAGVQRESSDPGAIIDWLLEHRAAVRP
jgi:general secretion pathway protein A